MVGHQYGFDCMDPNATQFANFLLFERLGSSDAGELWRGYRIYDDGREALWVDRLASGSTAQDTFVQALSHSVEIALDDDHPGLAPIVEMGIVQRQYYVAGHLKAGQSLDRLVERCRALDLSMPVAVALTITRDVLKALKAQLLSPNRNERAVRSLSGHNIWIGYDGHVQLGWSGLRAIDAAKKELHKTRLYDCTRDLLEHLANMLTIGRGANQKADTADSIPDSVTSIIRATMANVTFSDLDFEQLLANFDQEAEHTTQRSGVDLGAFVSSLFNRERAVDTAKQSRNQRMIADMPAGARKVIARGAGQILVQTAEKRIIQSIKPRPVLARPGGAAKYEGATSNLGLPKLLYRYSVSQVTGVMYLDDDEAELELHWQDGQLHRVLSKQSGRSFMDFLVQNEALDPGQVETLNLAGVHTLSSIVPAIVGATSVNHYELLDACQRYETSQLTDVFGWSRVNYAFFEHPPEAGFQALTQGKLLSLINDSVRESIPSERISAFVQANTHCRVLQRNHAYISVTDLRLNTRQLRVWNAMDQEEPMSSLMTRLTSLPGVDQTTVEGVLYLLERFDLITFEGQ
ncbi:MAG: hypothetical protein VX589_12445 [Myxococcota bacterium]|nr:hypothetical protein [Myxococcota bacterium]